jgi:hypothetical protein
MSHLPMASVKITCIREQNGLHNPAQRGLFDLDEKMEMVL